MFEDILNEIRSHAVIVLHRHTKPDGDALGSQIGLKHILKESFPDKQVYAVGDEAGRYAFMEDSRMDEIPDEIFRGALSIILDCGAASLVSDDRYRLADSTVRFDHHLFCGQFAEHEAIDSSFESCCGLITEFALTCGLSVPPLAAKSLFIGMVTDSGRFRYDTTSPRTFRLAAFLTEQPFDTDQLYADLYAEDYESKKRKAEFLLKIRFTPHNAAYIYTTREEADALPLDTFSISRGMVSTMADIKGVEIWVNFTETENGVLCELRSSRHNINPVAVKYGGGGHAKASGATVKDREEAMLLLRDLDELAERKGE